MLTRRTLLLASSAFMFAVPVHAQDSAADQASDPAVANEEIIVTAVARSANRLDSSVSVSSLNADAIATASPRSAAELFRNLPGIRSESSGGEGNANIQSRGIPISTGGAKFLQLQEDGLPILEYGDIAFGNADIFLRTDLNIARVESVRGGSASTFASNSPGGVINLISRTGDVEGGSIQASGGLDYDEYRIDAVYGGALSDSVRFNVGGFYRAGEGPRRAGYKGNKGGQIKGNVTKTFDGGFFRLNFKYLDDRAIAYLPSPVRVTGSNGSPEYSALPDLSPNNDTIHSAYFNRVVTLDGQNNRATDDVRDGMHPIVKSVGFETEFEVADGWTVSDKFRYADIGGRFISPFPATVDTAQNLANGIGGAGSVVTYANGPRAGQLYANPTTSNAIGIVMFNTALNSLDNITNDLRINRKFETGSGSVDLSLGFYKSRQTIDMDWTWTSYLLDAQGDNAALLNVRSASGVLQTDNGLIAQSASFFGNCCRRSYNLDFDTNAPFISASYNADKLTIDGSVRYDAGQARGFVVGDGPVTSFDVDGNGVISKPETQTTVVPLNATRPVNYDFNYWSYSAGVNYRIANNLSVFARYSRGGRANADRYVFGGNTSPTSGGLLPGARPVDFVRQAEAGVKYQDRGVNLYATGFWAKTQEQNYEATTQRSTSNTYRAYGLELEGSYRIGDFTLAASGTYTNAKILQSNDRAVIGNRPRRQAEFIYRIAPQYSSGMFTIGAAAVGTTSSFTQDSNQLKLPGFTQVNAFLSVRPLDRVQVSVNANNLFDTTGYTEAEEGSIPANGIVRARSINGRTVSAAIKFDF
ncbi:outer membrane receptor protein involved in Fe transport [Novosphingobium hassiacum]|uniref:Outer membrane receptor protein involved in Fe transport n=1 Tax=Novosphingobium hassiacum TaxID=173676 RepID=A0A7W5ZX37_9SPHN|nr:TonB-dependent receptor [Novosphingobium hassiacum]MBB3860728.1 outer membrane receptor protein involved in Fe transport [Novosphingobium hassiacum]